MALLCAIKPAPATYMIKRFPCLPSDLAQWLSWPRTATDKALQLPWGLSCALEEEQTAMLSSCLLEVLPPHTQTESCQRAPESCQGPFPRQISGEDKSMFPALDTGVSPPLQSQRQNHSCQSQQREWWDRLGAGIKVGLQGQGSQALCHELGWPMNNQPALPSKTVSRYSALWFKNTPQNYVKKVIKKTKEFKW